MADDSNVLGQLDHISGFQLNDIRKALILATANFLAAVGCMNTIEFLGGVRNGKLGIKGEVESRFKEGVRLLGGEYSTFGEDNVYNLRNGLTHQYVPSLHGFAHIMVVNDWNADKAIIKDGHKLTLNVAKLVVDLEAAWGRLRCELLQDDTKRNEVRKALNRLPKLL